QTQLADPRGVSGGIGEALITTASGLTVALISLFPYMIFKGLADRAMGRMESVIAAAQTGLPKRPAPMQEPAQQSAGV
ncbi:MAG: MotA/TolQ/ExbB proton channel family protein, partial [Proteobacteria bacterium]|nr:MotA/TolQ/ExbB proton channel family protein [Pseudomonadota bacterium]